MAWKKRHTGIGMKIVLKYFFYHLSIEKKKKNHLQQNPSCLYAAQHSIIIFPPSFSLANYFFI